MVSITEITLRLILGAIIGGIIGFEREIHGRAAGFRTQLLVCVAAVLIMIISENFYLKLNYLDPSLRIDPARIAASALIGIGFLGAGVIVKSGYTIRGLTTAASIWIVSVIGLAIGGGFYIEATIAFLVTLIALVILRKIEKNLKILVYKTVTVSSGISENAEGIISSIFRDSGIRINSVDYDKNTMDSTMSFIFSISTRDKRVIKDVFHKIAALDFIKTVRVNSREDSF
jgi:putative Mg2+ transporter-C (MgtC) family protein